MALGNAGAAFNPLGAAFNATAGQFGHQFGIAHHPAGQRMPSRNYAHIIQSHIHFFTTKNPASAGFFLLLTSVDAGL
jgi:hypothetical protein